MLKAATVGHPLREQKANKKFSEYNKIQQKQITPSITLNKHFIELWLWLFYHGIKVLKKMISQKQEKKQKIITEKKKVISGLLWLRHMAKKILYVIEDNY